MGSLTDRRSGPVPPSVRTVAIFRDLSYAVMLQNDMQCYKGHTDTRLAVRGCGRVAPCQEVPTSGPARSFDRLLPPSSSPSRAVEFRPHMAPASSLAFPCFPNTAKPVAAPMHPLCPECLCHVQAVLDSPQDGIQASRRRTLSNPHSLC